MTVDHMYEVLRRKAEESDPLGGLNVPIFGALGRYDYAGVS